MLPRIFVLGEGRSQSYLLGAAQFPLLLLQIDSTIEAFFLH
jgi:hypothetical protein